MSTQDPTPTPEELEILEDVIRLVARAGRLRSADADDFSQSVHLRLIEREYDIFSRFDRRSSLRTYLTVVVRRLLLDWRNANLGKWRPSAEAHRLGPSAVALERMVHRDAQPAAEAIQVLRSRGCLESSAQLRTLWASLPARFTRRIVFSDGQLPAPCTPFEDPIDVEERRRKRSRLAWAVRRLVRELSAEDRWLLRARYTQTASVQAVARELQIDAKVLYRRLDNMLRSMRRALRSQGLTDTWTC